MKKAYWDIEVNSKGYDMFPDPTLAPCPVDAISYYNEIDSVLHGFLLDCPSFENPLIQEFRDNGMDDFIKEIEEEFTAMANKHFKFGKKVKVELHFFTKELDLIKAFFDKVNDENLSPDVLLAWNQSFDFQTIMNRISFLGKEPGQLPFRRIRGASQ
jgi:hypothetical protein